MTEMIKTFGELTATQQPLGGGKGGTLARLFQAGYPVPDGFVVLPPSFSGDRLKSEAWEKVQSHLAQMRQANPGTAFAVRSSALSEDSAQASFAGEFETVLDVHSDEMVKEAIQAVRRSRHSERVRAYSEAKGIDTAHDMAVVVQRLIRADIAGVLFTADPVTGSRVNMIGNYVYGFGEELVSGEAEPYTFSLQLPKGTYAGPPELKRYAKPLFRLGRRLQQDLGYPQDVEWAVAGGKLFLLQSRPITTLIDQCPETGEQNATLKGDYLWTNILNVEIYPIAMTPSTSSVWWILLNKLSMGGDSPSFGNIAGRPYVNFSMLYSFMKLTARNHEKVMGMLDKYIGLPPEGTEIPPFPISIKTLLFELVPQEMRAGSVKKKLKKNKSQFLGAVPDRCRQWRRKIRETREKPFLTSLWRQEIRPLFEQLFTLQDGLNEDFAMGSGRVKTELVKRLGQDEAEHLLSTFGGHSDQMASIGPMIGLARVKAGEITGDEYMALYGHRGPYENYLSVPRPYEDPAWLEQKLREFDRSTLDVRRLIERRGSEFELAWDQAARNLKPSKATTLRAQLTQIAETCMAREATRSELTRVVGVIREVFLRAGELTGLDDQVFYLSIDELAQVLSGDDSPTVHIPARQATHARYSALPAMPNWIRGRFDPFQWAADPQRRADIYDPVSPLAALDTGNLIQGNAGSAGRVEGFVRRIDDADEGDQFKPGEVLVTSTTNIGWTPLFPRAAAIVTDIGGSLSHAAIVAREIGVPAVVGCGTATMRLKTGDRVLVDGGRGVVEILQTA